MVKKLLYLWMVIFSLKIMETFLPPPKRWQELLEIAKVAGGRIKSPSNHKRQNSLKRLKLCTLGKMQVYIYIYIDR